MVIRITNFDSIRPFLVLFGDHFPHDDDGYYFANATKTFPSEFINLIWYGSIAEISSASGKRKISLIFDARRPNRKRTRSVEELTWQTYFSTCSQTKKFNDITNSFGQCGITNGFRYDFEHPTSIEIGIATHFVQSTTRARTETFARHLLNNKNEHKMKWKEQREERENFSSGSKFTGSHRWEFYAETFSTRSIIPQVFFRTRRCCCCLAEHK